MDDNYKSISELSKLTGVDRATIGKRLAGISPKFAEKGAKTYDVRAALPLILENKNASEDEAKVRRANADAEKAELVVKRLKGELVSVYEMNQAVTEVFKSLFQTIVRVKPQVIASKVVGLTDLTEIEIAIREELSPIFDDVRNNPENYLASAIETEELEDDLD